MVTMRRTVSVGAFAVACWLGGACDGAGERRADTQLVARVTHRDTAIIDGTGPTCLHCSLELMPAIRLGTPEDRDIPQRVPDILRDGRGTHYLVFDGWSNKPILRYDSLGQFIGRLGRYGQGPGEYTMTFGAIVAPGDSIVVLLSGQHGQVFTPEGSFARPFRVASSGHKVFGVARDGSGALYATPNSARSWDGQSPWVVRIGPDGVPSDSFPVFSARVGTSTIRSGSNERQVTVRNSGIPTLAPDGSIWTMTRGNRLERHGPDGTTRQLIGLTSPDREPPSLTVAHAESVAATRTRDGLYVNRVTVHPSNRKVRIRPTETMSVDSAGLLWILRTIAAPRLDTITVNVQYLSPDEAPGEATIPREVEDRLYHTIVEVIDPRGPELLARIELPFQGHAAAPGYVGRVTQDAAGHYVSSIYRLVLRRQ